MRDAGEFGERPIRKRKKLKRYFLIFEGKKTEPRYFLGVTKYKNKIGINNLITIYTLKRDVEDKNKSNPYKILFELCNDIEKYIESKHDYYEKEIDKVCFFFDRDPKSFTKEQYDKVKEECKNKNYRLCISNPYFELWLLFHFDISDIKHEDIKNNNKVDKMPFIKHTLKSKNSGYNKSQLDFEKFKDGISLAIENSKKFETDLEKLKDATGTNIGLLFEEWLNNKS